MVMPVLSYGCEIWGFHPAKAIEQEHKDFCKSIFKLKRTTMNEIMYCELGRVPLIVRIYITIVKYWLKILNMKQTHLRKVLYNVQFYALTNNHTIVNLVSKVTNLLCSYGFGEAWYNQGVNQGGDVNIFLVFFKERTIDLYLSTQLRTRNHKLHVETGSWCKPRSTPFDESLCFICDRDELENEHHFVLCCPAYTVLRKKYIKKNIIIYILVCINLQNY